jgi:ubiquitin-protein ligase
MLTEMRWQKEQELMQSVFPQFKPFTKHTVFGFEGHLKGRRSGQVYRVVLEAEQAKYPQWPPNVRVDPQVGPYWISDRGRRRLCMTRNWQAARSTFANTLLAVVRYIDEQDGQPPPAEHFLHGNPDTGPERW